MKLGRAYASALQGTHSFPPCSPSARRVIASRSIITASAVPRLPTRITSWTTKPSAKAATLRATTPEELLGLVAMWEVRGDDWRLKPGEAAIDDELHAASRTFNREGNELPEN